MPIDNRTLLEKADLAIADLTTGGGILQPAQAIKFLRLAIKNAKLLPLTTVVPMKAQKQTVESIRFAGRILHPGQEATELPAASRSKPTTGKVELDAQLFKGEVNLSDEVLEDNIERDELRNTIMTLMSEAVGRDMEEVVINGDTTSTDPFLAVFDGVLKQATSNVVNASGTALTKTVLRNTVKAMPVEYRRDKSVLKFLTSTNAEIGYRDSLADRATNLGDRAVSESMEAYYSGIPVVDIPLFPEDLGGANRTAVLFCDPKNINVGVWRQIKIATDKNVRAGTLMIVVTLRFDVKYSVEEAVTKAINVAV